MESEDLTQLLNHYLTEMSKIALVHGGTMRSQFGERNRPAGPAVITRQEQRPAGKPAAK